MNVSGYSPRRRPRCQRCVARCGRGLLAKRKPDIPDDFVAKLFGACRPGGPRALQPRRCLPASPSGHGHSSAERPAGAPKIRFEPAWLRRAALPCLRSSTTICRSWSIPSPANSISAASISAYSSIRCSRSSAIPRASLIRFMPARAVGGSRESFIHLHVEGADECSAARGNRPGARETFSPTCAPACRTGGRCWREFAASSPNCGRIRRRFRSTRSPKPFSFWNGSRRTISRSSARGILLSRLPATCSNRTFATGLGLLRSREVGACCSAGTSR